MLTKADIRLVKSLNEKKERFANKLFVAEGNKLVIELLGSKLKIVRLFTTENWLHEHQTKVGKNIEITLVKQTDISKLSNLKSKPEVLALCSIPEYTVDLNNLKSLTLVLDTIQDPGNLGTIIRVADWYGIKQILCSLETADCFNPKVVQATMGSISRVKLFYGDLPYWLKNCKQPILAASMEGTSVHQYQFEANCLLIIGNEGVGISDSLKPFISNTISIPKFGRAESLNAAIAASIIIDRYTSALA